ncbi:hypothetical protein LR48_Vigan08g123900 [Vigna angularis]|uniref:Uncharacterized protein n=1 Tax=Phaseolus angularis TaxID=3914 RepID=A0A0L9V625_PHAAN|nr:hypothetical protein LR48_Vigan08g123900 [Vigna angularis]
MQDARTSRTFVQDSGRWSRGKGRSSPANERSLREKWTFVECERTRGRSSRKDKIGRSSKREERTLAREVDVRPAKKQADARPEISGRSSRVEARADARPPSRRGRSSQAEEDARPRQKRTLVQPRRSSVSGRSAAIRDARPFLVDARPLSIFPDDPRRARQGAGRDFLRESRARARKQRGVGRHFSRIMIFSESLAPGRD